MELVCTSADVDNRCRGRAVTFRLLRPCHMLGKPICGNHLEKRNPFPAETGTLTRVCGNTTIVALVLQVSHSAIPTVAVAHRLPHRPI